MLDSASGHSRVRVIHSRHHTRDTRFDQRVGARRGLAMVSAGFECDISGRPFGSRAGARQRFALGVIIIGGVGFRFGIERIAIGVHRRENRLFIFHADKGHCVVDLTGLSFSSAVERALSAINEE